MWFLLLLGGLVALVYGCYWLFNFGKRQLRDEALTPLETLMDAADTTDGQLLAALLQHDVLVAMEPTGDGSAGWVPLCLSNGTGNPSFVTAAASRQAADRFSEALRAQGAAFSPFTHATRMKIATWVLDGGQNVGIKLVGRSPSGDFNTATIGADVLADVRETARQLEAAEAKVAAE